MSSQAKMVREFTAESLGIELPTRPCLMTKDQVHFVIKMVLDEMMELYATVEGPEKAKLSMIGMITSSKDIEKARAPEIELVSLQADALVDANYYMLNAAAKCGINLDRVFEEVHKANLSKRDPDTGKYLKNKEGKIIKPKNWEDPDVIGEILYQLKHGSWTQ